MRTRTPTHILILVCVCCYFFLSFFLCLDVFFSVLFYVFHYFFPLFLISLFLAASVPVVAAASVPTETGRLSPQSPVPLSRPLSRSLSPPPSCDGGGPGGTDCGRTTTSYSNVVEQLVAARRAKLPPANSASSEAAQESPQSCPTTAPGAEIWHARHACSSLAQIDQFGSNLESWPRC